MAEIDKMQKDLMQIKSALERLATENMQHQQAIKEKAKAEDTNSNLLLLLKYLMDENKKNTMLMQNISDTITAIAEEFEAARRPEPESNEKRKKAAQKREVVSKEIPLSDRDAKIIEFIQQKGMACADDIKSEMQYNGRNAASARLNSLYKIGLLQRYQLGHKVYYKYNADRLTDTMLILPPQ